MGTMEGTECMLKNIGVSYSLTPSIAKYGLTAIANSTASEEARTQLMKNGAGTQLQFELSKLYISN
jgi:hypothetical protein